MVTVTVHPVHFEDYSGLQFERLNPQLLKMGGLPRREPGWTSLSVGITKSTDTVA